jgi:hypothetical protein
MKSSTIIFVLLAVLNYCYPQTELVYFGSLNPDKSVKLEDQYTFLKNQDYWGKSEYGINYDNYYKYIENIVKSNLPNYSDTVYEYQLNEYMPEIDKLTNIKIGDNFYITNEKGVYKTEVTAYNVNLNDQIGGGVMFYPLLKAVENDEHEILLISKKSNIGKIIWSNVKDRNVINSIKKSVLAKIKHIKVIEGDDAGKTISLIKDDEIKILKGSFTKKGAEEYLVSWCKRIAFDSYACVTYLMDDGGSIIKTVFGLREKEFYFTNASAVCDINGDNIDEIITEEGYYEGHGWAVWKFDGIEWIMVTSGFYFGV